jgi:hypothetical protein
MEKKLTILLVLTLIIIASCSPFNKIGSPIFPKAFLMPSASKNKTDEQIQKNSDIQAKKMFLLLTIKSSSYQWEYSKDLHDALWGGKIQEIEKANSNKKILLTPQISFSYKPVFIRGFYCQSLSDFQLYGNGSFDNIGIDIGVGSPMMGLSFFLGWRRMTSEFKNWSTNNAKDLSISDFGLGVSIGYPINLIKKHGLVINFQGFVGGQTPILGLGSNQPTIIETELNAGYKLKRPNLVLIAGYEYKFYGKTGEEFHSNYKDYVYQWNNKIKSISITAIYSF